MTPLDQYEQTRKRFETAKRNAFIAAYVGIVCGVVAVISIICHC